jgi:hypothetical protein
MKLYVELAQIEFIATDGGDQGALVQFKVTRDGNAATAFMVPVVVLVPWGEEANVVRLARAEFALFAEALSDAARSLDR